MKIESLEILIGKETVGKLKVGDLVKWPDYSDNREDKPGEYFNAVYAGQCKVNDKGIERDGIAFIKREASGRILYFKQPFDSVSMVGDFIVIDSQSEEDTIKEFMAISKDYIRVSLRDIIQYYTKKDKEYQTYDKMLRRHNL